MKSCLNSIPQVSVLLSKINTKNPARGKAGRIVCPSFTNIMMSGARNISFGAAQWSCGCMCILTRLRAFSWLLTFTSYNEYINLSRSAAKPPQQGEEHASARVPQRNHQETEKGAAVPHTCHGKIVHIRHAVLSPAENENRDSEQK